MLDFSATLEVIQRQFRQVHVQKLFVPYHQPPEQPDFHKLIADYGHFLDDIPSRRGCGW